MRGLNLVVLLVGLSLVGAALYGFAGVDSSLKLAASHGAPAPQSVLEQQAPPCDQQHRGNDRSTPGV